MNFDSQERESCPVQYFHQTRLREGEEMGELQGGVTVEVGHFHQQTRIF
jgi:hypothetical protein